MIYRKKGGRQEVKHLGEVGSDQSIYSQLKGGYYA